MVDVGYLNKTVVVPHLTCDRLMTVSAVEFFIVTLNLSVSVACGELLICTDTNVTLHLIGCDEGMIVIIRFPQWFKCSVDDAEDTHPHTLQLTFQSHVVHYSTVTPCVVDTLFLDVFTKLKIHLGKYASSSHWEMWDKSLSTYLFHLQQMELYWSNEIRFLESWSDLSKNTCINSIDLTKNTNNCLAAE